MLATSPSSAAKTAARSSLSSSVGAGRARSSASKRKPSKRQAAAWRARTLFRRRSAKARWRRLSARSGLSRRRGRLSSTAGTSGFSIGVGTGGAVGFSGVVCLGWAGVFDWKGKSRWGVVGPRCHAFTVLCSARLVKEVDQGPKQWCHQRVFQNGRALTSEVLFFSFRGGFFQ